MGCKFTYQEGFKFPNQSKPKDCLKTTQKVISQNMCAHTHTHTHTPPLKMGQNKNTKRSKSFWATETHMGVSFVWGTPFCGFKRKPKKNRSQFGGEGPIPKEKNAHMTVGQKWTPKIETLANGNLD